MKRALLLLLLPGCATTPTPDLEAERTALFQRSEVMCFGAVILADQPGVTARLMGILESRGVTCTAELAEKGEKAINAQLEREERLAATQSRERQQSANNAADRLFRGLMGFAAGYAIGQSLQPPPPSMSPPVRCTTRFVGNQAYTQCN